MNISSKFSKTITNLILRISLIIFMQFISILNKFWKYFLFTPKSWSGFWIEDCLYLALGIGSGSGLWFLKSLDLDPKAGSGLRFFWKLDPDPDFDCKVTIRYTVQKSIMNARKNRNKEYLKIQVCGLWFLKSQSGYRSGSSFQKNRNPDTDPVFRI